MDQMNKIKEAAVPLQQILQECYDPMHVIAVSSQGIEILGRLAGIPTESACGGTFDSESGYFVPEHDSQSGR